MNNILDITDPKQDRYATLRLIPDWDQDRLARARVLIIGAGALGNEVLKNLALLGVGHIAVVDFDVVEIANLSRSVLYRPDDAGRPKAQVAARRMYELNPDVKVAPIVADVGEDLGLGIFRWADVVLGCLDNRAARLAVNRACFRINQSWIDGALDVLMGSVKVYQPPYGSCYECGMTAQDYALINARYSCTGATEQPSVSGRIPTTPTSAALIGAVMVQEAVKQLHGWSVQTGKVFVYNGHTMRTMLLQLPTRDGCGSHDTWEELATLDLQADTTTVLKLLDRAVEYVGSDPSLLLDRELVQSLSCPTCRTQQRVYRPYDEVVPHAVACPHCHDNRIPNVIVRLHGQTPSADRTLAQLGIPAWHIVRVEGRDRRVAIELHGDRNTLSFYSPEVADDQKTIESTNQTASQ